MYNLSTSIVSISANLNRLKLIDISLTLFKEHPLIGSGAGSFISIVSGLKWYIIEYGSPLDAHGILFKLIAETGLLGLLSFCLFAGYILWLLYKHYQKNKMTSWKMVAMACLLCVLGGLIFQLFGTGYYLAKLWLPIGVALASLKFYNHS